MPEMLPPSLAGKTVGVWGDVPTKFDTDLERLKCKIIRLSLDATPAQAKNLNFFVLDGLTWMNDGYVTKTRRYLDAYQKLANGRFCYGIFPYVTLNYGWDVHNQGAPALQGNLLPGARWNYDELLSDFAARAVSNIRVDEHVSSIVTRLLPLDRTLLCIMAASGQGKTTLVRQLTNQHDVFHTSSDYLLTTIIALEAGSDPSPQVVKLKAAIETLKPDQIWAKFFRLLDEDAELLSCFLELAWQHMQLAKSSSLISFDIDLRLDSGKQNAKNFFRDKNLKVWECNT